MKLTHGDAKRGQLASLATLACVIAGVVALAWSSSLPGVALLARTMMVMGGTEHPLVTPGGPGQPVGWAYPSYPLDEPGLADPDAGGVPAGYVLAVHDNYVVPWGAEGEQYQAVAVYSPEEFFPVQGSRTFDDSVAIGYGNASACLHGGADCVAHIYPGGGYAPSYVVVGYSQSAVIASLLKQQLIENPDTAPETSFVLLANPMRPNGGLLQRLPHGMTIPILGITAYGPTPTNSCDADGHCAFPTMDIAQQYDALGGDFPIYPLHLPAVANSVVAYLLTHGAVPDQSLDAAISQGVYGDTSYYLLPTDLVPLLMPFEGIVPRPLLLALDEPLRVLIEAGYRRDISPGEPTPAQLIPVINPITLTVNLVRSVPVGIDNAVEDLTGDRPLGTVDPGPYGVGGDDAELAGAPPGLVPLGSSQASPQTVPQLASTTSEPVVVDSEALQMDSEPAGKPVIRRSTPQQALTREPADDSGKNQRLEPEDDGTGTLSGSSAGPSAGTPGAEDTGTMGADTEDASTDTDTDTDT